jgi:hypothetical protein
MICSNLAQCLTLGQRWHGTGAGPSSVFAGHRLRPCAAPSFVRKHLRSAVPVVLMRVTQRSSVAAPLDALPRRGRLPEDGTQYLAHPF